MASAELLSALSKAEIVDVRDCLTRESKEKIVVCYEEKALCQKDLAKAIQPPAIDKSWPIIVIATLGGLAAGMILSKQVGR